MRNNVSSTQEDSGGTVTFVTQESNQHEGELVGLDEIPPSLDRLNWGAVLVPFLWAIAHGLWSWVGVFGAMRVFLWGVGGMMRRFHIEAVLPNVLISVLAALIGWAVVLFFAWRANKLYWRREVKRVERRSAKPNFRWPHSIDSYAESQGQWTVFGIALYVLGTVLTIYNAFSKDARFPWVPAAIVAVTLVNVVVLAALFVWDRRTRAGAS